MSDKQEERRLVFHTTALGEDDVPFSRTTEVRALLAKLAQSDPDIRGGAAAELESTVMETADVLLGLKAVFLSDAPEEERFHAAIFLGAILEWLQNAGEPARHALHCFERLVSSDTPSNRQRFLQAARMVEAVLMKSPLTLWDESERTRFALGGPPWAGETENRASPISGESASGGQAFRVDSPHVTDDTMEDPHRAQYPIDEVAHQLGVSRSTLQAWVNSGKIRVEGGVDPTTGEYSFTNDDLTALKAHRVSLVTKYLLDDPGEWIDTPNQFMGGHSPRELLGTDREQVVFDLLEGIKHGVVA